MVEKIKKNILPLFFGTAVSATILYLYHYESIIWLSALMFCYEVLLFFLFDKLSKRRVLGGIAYTLLLIFVMLGCSMLIWNGQMQYEGILTFKQWFYISQSEDTFCIYYSMALFIGGGFFISSILYYFTQIIYRGIGTLLILLIPFIITSKREDSINDIFLILMFISYFGVMVHNRQMSSKAGVKVISNRSYITSVSIFIGVVVAVSMIIPKPKIISVQEKNSEFFDTLFSTNIAIGGTIAFLSGQNTSIPNSGQNYLSNRILFYVDTPKLFNQPLYLRSSTYNYYATNKWNRLYFNKEYKENMDINIEDWRTYQISNYALIKKTIDYSAGENVKNFTVVPNTQTSNVILAPLWTTSVVSKNLLMNRTYSSDIYSNKNWQTYDVTYYPETQELREDIRNLAWTQTDLEKFLTENSEDKQIQKVRKEYENAKKYYSNRNDIVSPTITELAQEITKDYTSDYDKAYAIEQYFTDNNFKYDLAYVPQDSSVDTFLFYSKTGICSDFATAMTILAREAGLPARYVEGFLVYEQNDEGRYVVRELHSHAFPEVYISGSGWVTFEPTVAGFMDIQNQNESPIWQNIQLILRALIVIILIAILISILFLKRLIEWFFRVTLKRKENNQAILNIYKHIVRLIEYKDKLSLSTYTPSMILKLVEEKYSYNIESIINTFESTLYGEKEVTNECRNKIYTEYLALYTVIKNTKKQKVTNKE